MTFEEIQQIENQLGIELPSEYKEFQLQYPTQLIDLGFIAEYLIDNPTYLIEVNELLQGGVPNEYLSIGHDIGGNYLFIKLNNADSTVYYLDHEDASEREASLEIKWEDLLTRNNSNLEEFANWLVEHWGEAF